jgi:hypothetical protein
MPARVLHLHLHREAIFQVLFFLPSASICPESKAEDCEIAARRYATASKPADPLSTPGSAFLFPWDPCLPRAAALMATWSGGCGGAAADAVYARRSLPAKPGGSAFRAPQSMASLCVTTPTADEAGAQGRPPATKICATIGACRAAEARDARARARRSVWPSAAYARRPAAPICAHRRKPPVCHAPRRRVRT